MRRSPTQERQEGMSNDARLQVVRDHTLMVADGSATGFYVHGPGGVGKTHTITCELKRTRTPYKIWNTRMTGLGLFEALEQFPEDVHVLEDMEGIFRSRAAASVLRSALWSGEADRQRHPERLVTWTTGHKHREIVVTGGIIMTGNDPFPETSELAAVRTRIGYWQLVVSDNEMIALMRKVAADGYSLADGPGLGVDRMDASECLEVCEHLVEQARGLRDQLNMRLLVKSYKYYLDWRECRTGCHWHDLVGTDLKGRPIKLDVAAVKTFRQRVGQKQDELRIASELAATVSDTPEQVRLWIERTGKSRPTYFRRLRELREVQADTRIVVQSQSQSQSQ
jgi:hypothetical protein